MYTAAVDPRRTLGQVAEEAASRFLARRGLAVVARNVRMRQGEIDLIARDGDRWVFVEVKCRHARWGDAPSAAVSWHKRRRLVRLAQLWLRWKGLGDAACRFDVVAVTVGARGAADIRHIPGAFDASGLA